MSATGTVRQRVEARRVRERTGAHAAVRPGQVAAESRAVAGFGTYVFATILITASLVFYVFLRVGSLQLGYRLSRERHQQIGLVQENRMLKTEIGTLSAPARIRQLAASKLGMVPAEHIVDLSEAAR